MTASQMNQTELARACGVKPPSVHGWLTGKAKFLRGENLLLAAKALGVTQEWLATGRGEMHQSPAASMPNARQVIAADQDDPNFVEIPMVKLKLSAGITGFNTDPDRRDGGTLGMRRNWIERRGYKPHKLIAIQVSGESMEPSLYADDVIVINTDDVQPVDGQVFAINYEGQAVVKRLARDAGEWWLTSDSPDQRKHARKVCRDDACIIIGRVVHKESDRI
ncbi:S24 family peptidase [Janthinobacterium sp. PAMC25594]|uniref:LexA family transcriptional regulator n=1 Tax=Janthinobacterium sp. PAMC25594 TaxID=2861284 RepID=UPI0021590880|nr:S24 family peptidase [Janthinobacterium sp. PAMC25594]